jgi:hypothetical protein
MKLGKIYLTTQCHTPSSVHQFSTVASSMFCFYSMQYSFEAKTHDVSYQTINEMAACSEGTHFWDLMHVER